MRVPMLVADASSTLDWFIEKPVSPATAGVFNVARRSCLVVPPIWVLETHNALLKLIRQRKLPVEDALDVKMELELLSKRIDTSLDQEIIDRTWHIANAHMTSFYDAAYVELAWRLDLPLASSDTAIRAAARTLKIRLL
jgi:predicted nucleic acid-binding protein